MQVLARVSNFIVYSIGRNFLLLHEFITGLLASAVTVPELFSKLESTGAASVSGYSGENVSSVQNLGKSYGVTVTK